MSEIHEVVRALITLEILDGTCRVKNRFVQPSDGGWRDLMINFCLPSSKHVCELQIVHNRMLTARKGVSLESCGVDWGGVGWERGRGDVI